MTKALRHTATVVALLLGIAGMAAALYAFRLPPFAGSTESTENAYVRGQVTIISPQLAGTVAEVLVKDFEPVKAGQLLVRIDDRIYEQKLRQAQASLATGKASLAALEQNRRSAEARVKAAEAQVDSARTALKTAEANWDRSEELQKRGVTAQSNADQARAALEQARAAVAQAEAAAEVARQDVASIEVSRRSLEAAVESGEASVRLAEIDLQNTRILSPADGRLGEVGARVGQYVAAGTQLLAVVPDRVWVTANFKETQLPGMRPGQKVTFTVDALGHAALTGHIESFSPATGSEFSVIRPDNATGNFTKIAQRLPVRIAIDPGQALAGRLAPGMSVVVAVDTAAPAMAGQPAAVADRL